MYKHPARQRWPMGQGGRSSLGIYHRLPSPHRKGKKMDTKHRTITICLLMLSAAVLGCSLVQSVLPQSNPATSAPEVSGSTSEPVESESGPRPGTWLAT